MKQTLLTYSFKYVKVFNMMLKTLTILEACTKRLWDGKGGMTEKEDIQKGKEQREIEKEFKHRRRR